MPNITINISDTTFVSSAQPDTNLSFYPLLYAGTDPIFQNCIGLLKIPLPSLPVENVDSAVLQLAVIVKNGTNPSPVMVNRVNDSFDIKTVNYYTCPGYTSTASQYDVSTSDLYTSIQIDVTNLINDWLNGTYENNGIVLTNPDGVSVVQFATEKIVYAPYFPKLTLAYPSTPVQKDLPYGRIYHTGGDIIAANASVPLDYNGPMYEITHQAGSGSVVVEKEGLYTVWFSVCAQTTNQFVLYQNEAILLDSAYGSTSGNNSGAATVNAKAGDQISLRNRTGSPVTLNNTAGGTQACVSASIFLLKIGENAVPDPVMAQVNAAQTPSAMQDAITDPALGLDLTAYNTLDASAQTLVANTVLTNRPSLGYLNVFDVQNVLDYSIHLITPVDPNEIYVRANSTGGNGSRAYPFGTIPEGIAAVNPGGTVRILEGDYPITARISVNKINITLSGEPGNRLLLSAPITAMSIMGSGVTVKNLNITSDIAYLGAFVEVLANNVTLMGNNIYGPPRTGVVNRAILLSSFSGIVVTDNYLHSLVQGISISSGAQGSVVNNHIEGTSTGIFVSSGLMTFTGNYWTGTSNDYDIGLMSSIAGYYQLDQLSLNNNNAKVQVF